MQKPINLPLTCFLILFGTLAIAGVGGMSVVTLREQIADSARRLQTSESETSRLERLSEELRTKIAILESPQALKIIAGRLGMQPAKLDQYRLMGTEISNASTAKVAGLKKNNLKSGRAYVSR